MSASSSPDLKAEARKKQAAAALKGPAAAAQRRRTDAEIATMRKRPPAKQTAPSPEVKKQPAEDPMEKELHQVIVDDLNDRLTRARETAEAYRNSNEQLTLRLAEEIQSKKDEVEIFNRDRLKLERLIEEGNARMQELRQQMELQQQQHENHIQELKHEHETGIWFVEAERDQLREENRELNEFKSSKDELHRKLQQLEDTLKEERITHHKDLQDCERKVAQERERLRKEMHDKIKEVRASILKMTDDQVETTTKRTIEENERLINELAYHAAQTQELVHLNDKLVAENRGFKQEVELLKQQATEMAKKNHATTKLFQAMAAKFKTTEQTLRSEHAREDRQLDTRVAALKEQVASLEETTAKQEKLIQELQESVTTAKTQSGMDKAELDKFKVLYADISDFLATFAGEMRSILGKSRPVSESRIAEDAAAALEEQLIVAEKERILQFLLTKLSAFPLLATKAEHAKEVAIRAPSTDTFESFGLRSPVSFAVHPLVTQARQQATPQTRHPAAPQPFKTGADGRSTLRPGEIQLHPVTSPVREWGKPAATKPLSLLHKQKHVNA